MLRLAVIFATSAGLRILATVHDALLVECDTVDADSVAAALRACMDRASTATIDVVVPVDVKRVVYPGSLCRRGRRTDVGHCLLGLIGRGARDAI